MIPLLSGVRVWIATGHTDMRRGMNGLTLQVQEGLRRDPHAGDLFVFRGRRGDLIKILWHDGLGMSLYAKRLERGRFIWPSPADGVVAITAAQLGYMLEGIDWRNPLHTWRPHAVGWGCEQVDSPIARAHHSRLRLWLNPVRADHNRHSPRRGRGAHSGTGRRAPGPPGGRGPGHWGRGHGGASQTGHRQIAARALWAIGRARRQAPRSARTPARGAGGERQ